MNRPSKKEIQAAVDKLKDKSSSSSNFEPKVGKLTEKKTTKRIRKQGV
jgi:hypothetical protein